MLSNQHSQFRRRKQGGWLEFEELYNERCRSLYIKQSGRIKGRRTKTRSIQYVKKYNIFEQSPLSGMVNPCSGSVIVSWPKYSSNFKKLFFWCWKFLFAIIKIPLAVYLLLFDRQPERNQMRNSAQHGEKQNITERLSKNRSVENDFSEVNKTFWYLSCCNHFFQRNV